MDTITVSTEPQPTNTLSRTLLRVTSNERNSPNNDSDETSDEGSLCCSPTAATSTVDQTLKKAIEMLRTQRTKTENLRIRDAVIAMLEECVETKHRHTLSPMLMQPREDHRINTIENDVKEIKEATKSMEKMLTASGNSRTWAQIAGDSPKKENANTHAHEEIAKRERLEQARKEKAKTQITLTFRNATEDQLKTLETTKEEVYAAELQKYIREQYPASMSGLTINKVQKLPGKMLKIECNTETEATQLQEVDWEKRLSGASLVHSEYGIVLHGVSKKVIDATTSTQKDIQEIIQSTNVINVQRVTPLTKKPRNPNAPTQSIVIFTRCPKEANDAIVDGIRIDGRYYAAKRYSPQHQIKQCFKCQGYGHKADSCTRKTTCGHCAQEHETRTCTQEVNKCTHCSGTHPAWHHECPRRLKEHEKLETLAAVTPPLFPC